MRSEQGNRGGEEERWAGPGAGLPWARVRFFFQFLRFLFCSFPDSILFCYHLIFEKCANCSTIIVAHYSTTTKSLVVK